MGFKDYVANIFCDCMAEDNGDTKLTIHVKDNKCCNKKKFVINMGNASAVEIEKVLRRINTKNDIKPDDLIPLGDVKE